MLRGTAHDDVRLELWGGVECTVNRVGDFFFDQIHFSGHDKRVDGIALFRSLGVKVLRYPVIWEKCEPARGHCEWSWPDERLREIREHDIVPLVGLLHHGSGPAWTGLLDPQFPQHLQRYAEAVAKRYPWIA